MIHINRSGTTLGTFSEEDVRQGCRVGRFVGTDLGWREGMAAWQPLAQFTEFAAELAAAGSAAAAAAAPAAAPPTATTVAVTPAPAAAEPVTPQGGLPWDEREQKGYLAAFFETMMMVLTKPDRAFTAMKREGGLTEPLIYGVTGGSLGLIVYFLYNFAFQSLGSLVGGGRHSMFHGVGWLGMIIVAPIFIVIGLFIGAAIVHLCLMLVGGAKHSFETTFRVMCFEGGSVGPLMVVPFCGGAVAGIWGIVVRCIGLARAHETDIGRAVLAVFLPVIICCGGGIFLAIFFGGLGALSQSWH